jgi:hypothetical protein
MRPSSRGLAMLVRLVCLAALLFLPRLSLAVDAWDAPPGGCPLENWSDVEAWRAWNSHTPPSNAMHWADEKTRYADNREVWRWYDRLYISMMDGKVLTLTDCPFGDDMSYYIYERYDVAGGFHVVHAWRYEDHSYALVVRSTGKIYTIPGLPVSSPDRSLFAYAACYPPDGTTDEGEAEIGIFSLVDNQPKMEAQMRMPCGASDCNLNWEGNAVVTATCEDPPGNGAKRSVMRFTREGDDWDAKTSKR